MKTRLLLSILLACTFLCLAQTETPQQAQFRTCRGNLKRLATALEHYAADNPEDGAPPLARLVPGYLKRLPTCPAANADTYSEAEWAGADFTVCCRGNHHNVGLDRPAYTSRGEMTGLPPSPAEQIVARHQLVLDQKRAIADKILAEQEVREPLLEAYRKIKSKNLPRETLIELVNAGAAITPPEKFPPLTTPPISAEERKILENEISPEGTSFLKVMEEIDKRMPDSEFAAFIESNQFMLRRNRWLRAKIGQL